MLTDVTIRVPDPELAAEFYVLLGGNRKCPNGPLPWSRLLG